MNFSFSMDVDTTVMNLLRRIPNGVMAWGLCLVTKEKRHYPLRPEITLCSIAHQIVMPLFHL